MQIYYGQDGILIGFGTKSAKILGLMFINLKCWGLRCSLDRQDKVIHSLFSILGTFSGITNFSHIHVKTQLSETWFSMVVARELLQRVLLISLVNILYHGGDIEVF